MRETIDEKKNRLKTQLAAAQMVGPHQRYSCDSCSVARHQLLKLWLKYPLPAPPKAKK
jgi:hypothetical protein